MDFSRPSAPVPKLNELNAVVEKACRMLSEKFSQHNIQSTLDLDRSVPEVPFDENQILQVLHNILRNAGDAMPKGGKVNVKTGREKDSAYVTVSDSGAGIEPDILERLFDPFITTKPDGTGLGLAVSKKIVDDHGGRIEVKTELGKGSRFTVYLPITPPPNAGPAGAQGVSQRVIPQASGAKA